MGSVYDGEIVHRGRVQSPLRPGLATDPALEGTDHTPGIQITSSSFPREGRIMWMGSLPVGDKDDGVRGRGGLDDHVVDVEKRLGEAKAMTE